MDKPSDIDLAIFSITNFYFRNPGFEITYLSLREILNMAEHSVVGLDMPTLEEKIKDSGLFIIKYSNSYQIPQMTIRPEKDTIQTLAQYGGYLKYIKRVKLSTVEILDLIFEQLKDGGSIQLGNFLADKLIEFDNNAIRRIRSSLKSSGLADVHEIDVQSGPEALVSINGKGLEELEDKSYSEYKAEIKRKKDTPSQSIHIGGSVTGSSVGQGRDLDLNSLSPVINTAPQSAQPQAAPAKKSDHTIWDKAKYISIIIGGIAGLGYLLKEVGKALGWW